jgi:hypothetical protein
VKKVQRKEKGEEKKKGQKTMLLRMTEVRGCVVAV